MDAPLSLPPLPMVVGAAVLVALAAHFGVRLLAGRLQRVTGRTRNGWDDVLAGGLARGAPFLAVALGVAVGRALAAPGPGWGAAVDAVIRVAALAQLAAWVGAGVGALVARRRAASLNDGRAGDAPAWTLLGHFVRAAVWLVVGLAALDGLGFDVTALLAGVGIGGLAIGLAVQNVLGDVLASLSIVVDRPFVIGDYLQVGELEGTVESIGLKTTRLRSLSGEQLVFANADLLGSRIRNFQRMSERRVVVRFALAHATAPVALARVPALLREVVEGVPGVRFDRAHLVGFGPGGIDHELVFFFLGPDFAPHMDARHAVNLGVLRRLVDEGLALALPAHLVHLRGPEDPPVTRGPSASPSTAPVT